MGGMKGNGREAIRGWEGWGRRPAKTGIDKRNVDAKKEREKKEKAITESKGVTLFDPYFDIVQVTVYGQARFFNPPPDQPAAEPSSGESPAAAAGADAAVQRGRTPTRVPPNRPRPHRRRRSPRPKRTTPTTPNLRTKSQKGRCRQAGGKCRGTV